MNETTTNVDETLRYIVERLEAIESSVWNHRVCDNKEGAQILDHLDRILELQANLATILGLLAQLVTSRGRGQPPTDGDGEPLPGILRAV